MRAPAQPKPPAAGALASEAAEAIDVWQCSCEAWERYFLALTRSRSPLDVMAANADLLTDSFTLGGDAAARLLRERGVKAPLLTDV